MISFDRRHVDLRLRQLARLRSSGVRYAARNMLNDLAFEMRKQWQREMPQKMKLRNQYTQRSVRVVKASAGPIESMQSVSGSVAVYMAAQEKGYTEPKKFQHGVALPAAGPGGRKFRGRTPKNKRPGGIPDLLDFPRTGGTIRPGNARQQVAIALKYAKRRGGQQVAYLSLKANRRGIYLLDPSRKRAVKKLIDLSHPAVDIPKNITASPALYRTMMRRERFFHRAILDQLRRAGLRG